MSADSLWISREMKCCDAPQPASLDVLLTNLIAGKLLPRANQWITTCPAAASLHSMLITWLRCEVQQPTEGAVEDWWWKLSQKSNRKHKVDKKSLHHVPGASVLLDFLYCPGKNMCQSRKGGNAKDFDSDPLSGTSDRTDSKYFKERQLDAQGNDKVIMSLGKLEPPAAQERQPDLLRGHWMSKKHLSTQEFVLKSLWKSPGCSSNLMIDDPERKAQTKPVSKLHKTAVDRALQSDNGHLDLFLRFLLRLCQESSQGLLRGLKIQVETCDSQSH